MTASDSIRSDLRPFVHEFVTESLVICGLAVLVGLTERLLLALHAPGPVLLIVQIAHWGLFSFAVVWLTYGMARTLVRNV